VDRTAKLYIGGKQVRPDGDTSLRVLACDGSVAGEVGRGSRKDVRNAVEAARKAQPAWGTRTAHNRAQILYYVAENLAARRNELVERLAAFSGDARDAAAEVDACVARLFSYGAWADKWDGRVHATPHRIVTLAMNEPLGVVGAVCPDERPLLGLVSLLAPLVAMGNAAVLVPSRAAPLAATDFYQVLDTSDVPGGVVNIVTGLHEDVVPALAAHDDVDGVWYFGSTEGSAAVEKASTGNMKRTWVSYGRTMDWMDPSSAEGHEFLREATQVKNVWIPYGE
jgi:aldehyde dehydrogenase (NAD+)